MKSKLLMSAAFATLLLAMPAMAAVDTKMVVDTEITTVTDLSHQDIKAILIDEVDSGGAVDHISFDSRMTASGMLGKAVYDGTGKRLATIDDIIINDAGTATSIVLSDGGFMGLGGKLAAFDYNLLTQRTDNGDLVMALSEDAIRQAAPFSYDAADAGDGRTQVMSISNYRISKVLDSTLSDPPGIKVAEVDNASFRDGQVDYLIAGFDKTLGMGGKMAAIKYNTVAATGNGDGGLNFELTENQANRFRSLSVLNVSSLQKGE
jgi:hypothetical protein